MRMPQQPPTEPSGELIVAQEVDFLLGEIDGSLDVNPEFGELGGDVMDFGERQVDRHGGSLLRHS